MSQENPQVEEENIENLRKQLISFLGEQVATRSIEQRDMLILSLRLGLKDEKCYTLVESGRILHTSPECIRRRQHLLLHKHIKDPSFFKLLQTYALIKRLPRGFDLYYPSANTFDSISL
ncbi:hypothetical protein KSF_011280 [Reticulibacter mediterranei]|uniref:Uncharacterized protein n=1 Tax=Reticulibacter mediterranei TaxID=2778369 RepID=A0A8J3IHX8_9CHLR|nr:hypothetical protein [Reticulibacter mediterranei]GHO91080.1 hypothetical protein KSF_011280 [Reticulibacter mediterranei]